MDVNVGAWYALYDPAWETVGLGEEASYPSFELADRRCPVFPVNWDVDVVEAANPLCFGR